MRRRILSLLGAAFAASFFSCGEDTTTAPTPALGSWTVYAPPYEGAWTHCDVQNDGTLWATVLLADSSRAAIVRHKDDRWAKDEFEPAITEALNDILMFDDGRGWACGNGGALLERRDGKWHLTRLYNDLEYIHLAGVDPSHVWVTAISRPYGVPAIFFYDGTDWREAAKPGDYTSYGPIYMTGPESGFMVARRYFGDEVLRLKGSSWQPALAFDDRLHFYDITGAGSASYAVGERRLGPERLGRVYQLTPEIKNITPEILMPEEYYYRACYVDDRGGLWVTAAPYGQRDRNYKLIYWNGERWLEAKVANDTGAVARFFAVDFAGGAGWAVGGTTYARYRRP